MYITFVVVTFGALMRIYVNEQEYAIVDGKEKDSNKNDIIATSLKGFKSNKKGKDESPHYHTLQCEAYGGPSEQDAQEMVYWQGMKHLH